MPWSKNMAARCVVATLVVIVGVLVGCDRTADPAGGVDRAPAAGTASVTPQTEADRWPSPADDACTAFGVAFEKATQEGNVNSMNEFVDWDVILDRVVGDPQGMDRFVEQFKRGAKIGVAGANGFSGELAKMVSQGGSYKFLRVRTRDGRKSVLFRQIPQTSGVNYHEFVLALNPQGTVRAIDFYNYLSAEYVSTTMRRLFVPLAANENRGFLATLTGQENELVKHFDQLRKMQDSAKAGQFTEALQVYKTLPESMRQDKTILLIRTQAAMQVNDAEYMQALSDFLRSFPADPCVDMLSIDYFTMKQQMDKALACVDRMIEAVGGDPYLLVLKGNTYLSQGDVAKARELFQAALDAEPTLLDAYTGFVDLGVVEKNYGETVRWLTEIGQRFQIEFIDFTTDPKYAEFVKSPEYEAWMQEGGSRE